MPDNDTIEVPPIPKLSLAEQKVAACSIYERLQSLLPACVARQSLSQEEADRTLGAMLRIAYTLDQADNHVDIREPIDPRAHAKALQKLNEELMPPRAGLRGRGYGKSPGGGGKSAPASAPFVPKPFTDEE